MASLEWTHCLQHSLHQSDVNVLGFQGEGMKNQSQEKGNVVFRFPKGKNTPLFTLIYKYIVTIMLWKNHKVSGVFRTASVITACAWISWAMLTQTGRGWVALHPEARLPVCSSARLPSGLGSGPVFLVFSRLKKEVTESVQAL